MDERKVPWSGESPESHLRLELQLEVQPRKTVGDLLEHRIGN